MASPTSRRLIDFYVTGTKRHPLHNRPAPMSGLVGYRGALCEKSDPRFLPLQTASILSAAPQKHPIPQHATTDPPDAPGRTSLAGTAPTAPIHGSLRVLLGGARAAALLGLLLGLLGLVHRLIKGALLLLLLLLLGALFGTLGSLPTARGPR